MGLEQAYEEGKMSERAYRVYQRYLKSMEQSINRKFASRLTYYFLVSLRILRFSPSRSLYLRQDLPQLEKMKNLRNSEPLTMTKLQSSI